MIYDKLSSESPVCICNSFTREIPLWPPCVCIFVMVTADENFTCIQGVLSLKSTVHWPFGLLSRPAQGLLPSEKEEAVIWSSVIDPSSIPRGVPAENKSRTDHGSWDSHGGGGTHIWKWRTSETQHLRCRVFRWQIASKKRGLSVTKSTKIGGLSVKCIKNRGFQCQNGQKFLNISSNLSKFSKISFFFCRKLSLVWLSN